MDLKFPWDKRNNFPILQKHPPRPIYWGIKINYKTIVPSSKVHKEAQKSLPFNFWKLFSHIQDHMNLAFLWLKLVKGKAVKQKLIEKPESTPSQKQCLHHQGELRQSLSIHHRIIDRIKSSKIKTFYLKFNLTSHISKIESLRFSHYYQKHKSKKVELIAYIIITILKEIHHSCFKSDRKMTFIYRNITRLDS